MNKFFFFTAIYFSIANCSDNNLQQTVENFFDRIKKININDTTEIFSKHIDRFRKKPLSNQIDNATKTLIASSLVLRGSMITKLVASGLLYLLIEEEITRK